MKVLELKRGTAVLIQKCKIIDVFFARFLGLMGRGHLPNDEAFLFPKCNSIHTFFMRVPIDVVFTQKDGVVVEVLNNLMPWRLLIPRRSVTHTIEMRAENASKLGISAGDRLICEGVFD